MSDNHLGSEKRASIDRVDFTRDLLPSVAGFSCGDEPWQQYMDRYLKEPGPGGLLSDVATWGNGAWLYSLAGEVLGFGSLGKMKLRWPDQNIKTQYPIVVAFGIDEQFHGLPIGPWEQRYARRVFLDIMAEALKLPLESAFLTLFVDDRNERAMRFYRKLEFTDVPSVKSHDADGNYHLMVARIRE